MNPRTARWLLAPSRQRRTLRLIKHHGPSLSYDAAWALITLHTAPDETPLVRAWVRENPGRAPGIHYDSWEDLSKQEQQRRHRWLRRHGRSPVQLLGLEAGLILSSGLHILDWGPPSRQRPHHRPTAPRPDTTGHG